MWSTATVVDPAHTAVLKDELRQVEQEMARLMALANMAGPSKLLAEEFRTLERRRTQLEQAQQPVTLPPAVDLDRLRALLAEWRERIRHEMPIARQMLRVLLPDRILFTPDTEQRTVELRGGLCGGPCFRAVTRTRNGGGPNGTNRTA